MVIRFTRAARFFCACALLLLTALVSVGTRSVSVSTPYTFRGRPLPVVIYRNISGGRPTDISFEEFKKDLAWLAENGYTALSESELVAALRREAPLPESPVLLLFDEGAKSFRTEALPVLKEAGLAWFPLSKSGLLSNELRAAGYPVMRVERVSGFTMGEQMNA
ncbi:MAG: hypothetical protein FWC27_13945 [Firmicutes bacterium]|nr:hypothetical protein [Bacillota bacterium]